MWLRRVGAVPGGIGSPKRRRHQRLLAGKLRCEGDRPVVARELTFSEEQLAM